MRAKLNTILIVVDIAIRQVESRERYTFARTIYVLEGVLVETLIDLEAGTASNAEPEGVR